MRLARAVKRRFGIAAPRMAVRTHVAWYWRWLLISFSLAAGLASAWWIYDIGSRLAGFNRGEADRSLAALSRQVTGLQRENGLLQARVAASERQLQIELATRKELTKSLKALQDQNAHLNEDLAFFRDLMSPAGKEGAISIYRFKVEHNLLPGEYRYRLLLLQAGQRDRPFRGRLELLVNASQNGKKIVVAVPSGGSAASPSFDLNFKYYQRVEGAFRIAPEAVVKSVQVRVFENGVTQPSLMQAVNLS